MIFVYQPCEECGYVIDDGGYKNGKYLCHDCLDKEDEGSKTK